MFYLVKEFALFHPERPVVTYGLCRQTWASAKAAAGGGSCGHSHRGRRVLRDMGQARCCCRPHDVARVERSTLTQHPKPKPKTLNRKSSTLNSKAAAFRSVKTLRARARVRECISA